ncbi:MAG TPA: stage V sporulation protein AD [Candidatus Caccovicinus merdipullorum]|uniref:Stage V sporulation protein AD n=1 Tax=Candidatus Caccovicinus merdipullorum TaxID=2840724 RepID=A0A9D1GJY6_9FIRM|nr:stage V sporulation protein AD [Candidatus Caccovicinus merdipullorum]
MQKGKASIQFEDSPYITSAASVAGTKEGEGPLGALFDVTEQDDMMGQENWEAAESSLQKKAARLAVEKAGLDQGKIRYLFAGDLLGQLIATSFGLMELDIPLFGLYGACSTMGEAMSLAAMAAAAGYGDRNLALASSHFATAEKQFRFPLAYGNQRPYSATWTATGCGAVVIENKAAFLRSGERKPMAKITGITTGKIVDFGLKDSMNMGAAMAPAAFHTIWQNFQDFGWDERQFDRIITGDLGTVGQTILLDLLRKEGYDLTGIHMDCGIELYDGEKQDTHAGGSGCGCSAITLCAMILPKIQEGIWRRVLFVPTGALLSTVSYNEGRSVPGIAHGVVIEHAE